jgi:hypothetical protein
VKTDTLILVGNFNTKRHSSNANHDVYSVIPGRGRDSSLLKNVYPGSGSHSVSCSIGTGGSFSRAKQPEYQVNHSLSFRAEVKIKETTPLLPLYLFMAQTKTTLHLQYLQYNTIR